MKSVMKAEMDTFFPDIVDKLSQAPTEEPYYYDLTKSTKKAGRLFSQKEREGVGKKQCWKLQADTLVRITTPRVLNVWGIMYAI